MCVSCVRKLRGRPTLCGTCLVATLTQLLVIGSMFRNDEFSRAMGVEIIRQVVRLCLHLSAHLVKGLCVDNVALAIHLPRNRSKGRTNFVVPGRSSRRSGVRGNVGSKLVGLVNNHTTEQVGVVVRIRVVIHDDKCLRLYTNRLGGVGARNDTIFTEHTIIKWCLVLPRSIAHAGLRMRPVDLCMNVKRQVKLV